MMSKDNIEPANITKPDRRLGDEWTDWDGNLQQDQPKAPWWLYVLISLIITALLSGGGILVHWLIAPRVAQLQAAMIAKWLLIAWVGLLGIWFALVWLTAMGVTWLRWPLKLLGGIRWSAELAIIIGKRFGWSRDKVAHAYVQLHNQLECLPSRIKNATDLLVLAPRCLNRESLLGMKAMKDKYGFSQVVVVGGTEARKAIAEIRPLGIIAIACERDLLVGLKDLNGRIPVVAFTNQRPEGPCKNTLIPLDSIEKSVKILLGKTL